MYCNFWENCKNEANTTLIDGTIGFVPIEWIWKNRHTHSTIIATLAYNKIKYLSIFKRNYSQFTEIFIEAMKKTSKPHKIVFISSDEHLCYALTHQTNQNIPYVRVLHYFYFVNTDGDVDFVNAIFIADRKKSSKSFRMFSLSEEFEWKIFVINRTFSIRHLSITIHNSTMQVDFSSSSTQKKIVDNEVHTFGLYVSRIQCVFYSRM